MDKPRYILSVDASKWPIDVKLDYARIGTAKAATAALAEVLSIIGGTMKWQWKWDNYVDLANIVFYVLLPSLKAIRHIAGTGSSSTLFKDNNFVVKAEPIHVEGGRAYGKMYPQANPYRIFVNSEVSPARAELALTHELIHVVEHKSGLKFSEDQIHHIAQIVLSEVVPLAVRLIARLPQGEKDVSVLRSESAPYLRRNRSRIRPCQ